MPREGETPVAQRRPGRVAAGPAFVVRCSGPGRRGPASASAWAAPNNSGGTPRDFLLPPRPGGCFAPAAWGDVTVAEPGTGLGTGSGRARPGAARWPPPRGPMPSPTPAGPTPDFRRAFPGCPGRLARPLAVAPCRRPPRRPSGRMRPVPGKRLMPAAGPAGSVAAAGAGLPGADAPRVPAGSAVVGAAGSVRAPPTDDRSAVASGSPSIAAGAGHPPRRQRFCQAAPRPPRTLRPTPTGPSPRRSVRSARSNRPRSARRPTEGGPALGRAGKLPGAPPLPELPSSASGSTRAVDMATGAEARPRLRRQCRPPGRIAVSPSCPLQQEPSRRRGH